MLHERIGLSKKESALVVDSLLEIMRGTLSQGEDVKISGFGHFMVRRKRARRGRNPKTGEELVIAPRAVVTFRASPILKEKINEEG